MASTLDVLVYQIQNAQTNSLAILQDENDYKSAVVGAVPNFDKNLRGEWVKLHFSFILIYDFP